MPDEQCDDTLTEQHERYLEARRAEVYNAAISRQPATRSDIEEVLKAIKDLKIQVADTQPGGYMALCCCPPENSQLPEEHWHCPVHGDMNAQGQLEDRD